MIDSIGNNGQRKNHTESPGKKLFVKYMVCLRDKLILKSELEDLGFSYNFSPHGAINFHESYTQDQYKKLNKRLSKYGMVVLDEDSSMLIDKIIQTIVQVIHYSESLPAVNFSDLVHQYSGKESESILKIFSDVKGMSVLQFIVIQKIERAKEILLYEDMSLSDIAELLNYKNKYYLSAQMKKVTGLTPSAFKRLKEERLKIVDQNEAVQN